MGKQHQRKFFHGGVPGLRVGDRILSASRVGIFGHNLIPSNPCDPTRVYVTTDYDEARSYAAIYKDLRNQTLPGDVYEVRAVGDLLSDPDYRGFDTHYSCDSARVIRIAMRRVCMSKVQIVRAKSRYLRWEDGSRVYDEDGYLLPSPSLRDHGYTDDDLRLLGQWRETQYGPHGLSVDTTAEERARLSRVAAERLANNF